MTDLASLGFAVDSSQLDKASKSLSDMAQSGKTAQVSTDVLVAAAARLGITVEEVEKRLAAANDNLKNNAEMSMKLADATKLASAANDNFATSMNSASQATKEAGRGFFGTVESVLSLAGHLKLLAVAAYALSPAFRGFVNAQIAKYFLELVPVTSLYNQAVLTLTATFNSLLTVFMKVTPLAIAAVVSFKTFFAVFDHGAALIEKYANSLRSLYSDDTVQNLEKLTRGQTDIISAEHVARATELGVRIKDASFTIEKFLTNNIIDFTGASLKLQGVWVNIVELFAKGALLLQKIPVDKIAAGAAAGVTMAIPGAAPIGTAIAVNAVKSSISSEDQTNSLQSATDRLSAMMGVANLAKESTEKLKASVGDLSEEFSIGGSFIARYSDAIKKLSEGAANQFDTWDKAVKSIERHTRAMEANSVSIGKDIAFQEQLRVETQLLTSTKGGLNAATDDQIDKFVELRTKGIDPVNAAIEAGIKLDKDRIKSFEEVSKAAGEAKTALAQASFEISNQRALEADRISSRALTAFSPGAKADIAEAQKRLELQDELNRGIATQEQVDERAASARKLALKSEIVQLSEIARARKLSSEQNLESTRLEEQLIGKTIAQQTELRANLAARQQLEQEASQKRTAFDNAQYERLKKINEELGKQTEINAKASLNDSIKFSRNTAFLSQEDVAIASQLKQIYPDVAKSLDSVEASAIQTARTFNVLSGSISNSLTSNLNDILDGTKNVKDGFSDMGRSVARSIQEMIIKLYVVIPLMRALQSTMSSMGFGVGSPEASAVAEGIAPVMHGGGIAGQDPTAGRSVSMGIFNYAPRLHSGLKPDEFPAILQKGEGVFTRGQMAAMGNNAPKITLNIIEDASRAGQVDQKNENGGTDITAYVDAIMARKAADPGSATSAALDNRKRLARR